MAQAIVAIDQGTTGSTALVMGTDGRVLGRANHEFPQHFPAPGWVEHEPLEIYDSVLSALAEACAQAALGPDQIVAVGITNQRETTLIWERATGKPIHRAIVWQDRRTADVCRRLREQGHASRVQSKTGLVLDPYFSATKIAWLLDQVPGARERAERGELLFGTVDSYLIWQLAGGAGANAPHVTDVSNASRTSLMDLRSLQWDESLCQLFRVPMAVLPTILPCAGVFARLSGQPGLAAGTPISGVAGDQQAATFGQGCFNVGDIKCTYGTGAFAMLNTGAQPKHSQHGLLTTVAWKIGDELVYALEGSSFIAGAAVQWLRDGLGIIQHSADIERLAASVPSSDGVVFVPALAGLGAPYWDPEARGLITGLTRGSTAAHLARATLEAIAFQVGDLITAMREDLGAPISRLRVDGGAAQNQLLMQFQSDVSGLTVERPAELETTARGAAMLAGIGAGIFRSGQEASRMFQIQDSLIPRMAESERAAHWQRWAAAVQRSRSPSPLRQAQGSGQGGVG
ncbi:MAG TPA: glycerol kinase GlpK [Polyangiaceae bacterium]|nr:glycerol kinase GlpK [Polyangiaceae bacterium]